MTHDRRPSSTQNFLLEHEELQVRLSALRASHEASLGSMAAARNRAQDHLSQSCQEIEELKCARATTQEQLERSQLAQAEASMLAQNLRAELDRHRQALRTQHALGQDLDSQLKESERIRHETEVKATSLHAEIEALTRVLASSHDENAALQISLQQTKTEAQRLNSFVTSLMSESHSLQADLLASRNGGENLRKHLELANSDRERAERRSRILELIVSKDSAVQAIEQERGSIPADHPAHDEIKELLRAQTEQKRKLIELMELAPRLSVPRQNQ